MNPVGFVENQLSLGMQIIYHLLHRIFHVPVLQTPREELSSSNSTHCALPTFFTNSKVLPSASLTSYQRSTLLGDVNVSYPDKYLYIDRGCFEVCGAYAGRLFACTKLVKNKESERGRVIGSHRIPYSHDLDGLNPSSFWLECLFS